MVDTKSQSSNTKINQKNEDELLNYQRSRNINKKSTTTRNDMTNIGSPINIK